MFFQQLSSKVLTAFSKTNIIVAEVSRYSKLPTAIKNGCLLPAILQLLAAQICRRHTVHHQLHILRNHKIDIFADIIYDFLDTDGFQSGLTFVKDSFNIRYKHLCLTKLMQNLCVPDFQFIFEKRVLFDHFSINKAKH
jgi:hypothetical protein